MSGQKRAGRAAQEPSVGQRTVDFLRYVRTGPLIILASLGLFFVLWGQVIDLLDRPVRTVKIGGELSHLTAEQIQSTLEPFVADSFFQVDMYGAKRALQRLPWVSSASLRRTWPDIIEVKLIEQQPLARWGETGFLNEKNEVFTPGKVGNHLQLPRLHGPEGSQEQVVRQFNALSKTFAPLQLRVTQLIMEARGAWKVQLNGQFWVMIGRDHLHERLHRFVKVYRNTLQSQRERIAQVDIRYPNGVAVDWHTTPETGSG